MRRTLFLISLVFVLFLVSCQDKININVDSSVTVFINEPYQLEYKTNDKKGLFFKSVNETMFVVDENGVITGLQKGQAFLMVRSKSDKDVSLFVTIYIEEGDYIDVVSNLSLKVDDEYLLDVNASFLTEFNFTSSDTSILTVSEEGKVKALKEGSVTITVTSKENENVKATVTVTITEGTTIEVLEQISLIRNESLKLNVNTDISKGVSYLSKDENIVTVSSDGTLTGVNKGVAIVKVVSKANEEIYKEVEVIVNQLLDAVLEVRFEEGETFLIGDLVTNPTFLSEDEGIVTVTEEGLITAIKPGYVIVKVISEDDDEIYEEVEVYVMAEPLSIKIIGKEEMLVGETQQLNLFVEPVYGSKDALYQSLNPTVLNVDFDGFVEAVNTGNAAVRVTSLKNPEMTHTIYISVISIIVVDSSKTEGDSINYSLYTFLYGDNLFSSISEAITNAVNNTKIIVFEGTYNEPLVIGRKINLLAKTNATISANIVLASSDVVIDGFIIKNGNITSTTNLSNIKILNNKFINTTANVVVKLENVTDINISYNEINNNQDNAILITGIKEGKNYINGNIIEGGNKGIKIFSREDYNLDTIIDVMWNKINGVKTPLEIDLGHGNNISEIRQVVRFNELSNYKTALITISEHNLDLNLNYWGNNGPDINDFENVKISDLSAFYIDKEEIVTEKDYDPRIPVKIEIINKIAEIEIGEEFTIEYIIYPRELKDNTVRWQYSNLPALIVDGATIKGIISWDVLITLSARDNANIKDSFMLSITTDPQLDFVPVNKTYSDFYVGNTFKLNVNVLPYQIREEGVIFNSSDENIATVTEGGIVTLFNEGLVTISAHLAIDPTIEQKFTFKVFDEIDLDDPFGFAISAMVNYGTFRSWNVYGVDFDYQAEFLDSVSRLLIEEIVINTSLMVPKEYTELRPGSISPRLKPNLPEDEIYNDAYVHYIVVHETANTNIGGGALMHAEYLFNRPDRIASWHFTVDDKEIYQHIPTDEVAYHAGDGSTIAGNPWADGKTGGIGGGNRNGIGIETSVALGDDIMSIWHRTARLAAKLAKEYNLPGDKHLEHVKFHQDFSGKVCPQSMIRGGLVDFFYGLVEKEFIREYKFPGLSLSINSHNLEYLSNNGRIIKRPYQPITVSYDLTITYNGQSKTETLYVYIPGEIK